MSIYDLPQKLNVQSRDYKIRSDFRPCLDIFTAFEDEELTELEKCRVAYEILYIEKPPVKFYEEALKQAYRFLNGGGMIKGESKNSRLFSWNKDSTYIFSGVDKTLGFSSRRTDYLHWWEFLAAFMDISEGMFSIILHLRQSKRKGKLTKEERQYWADNKSLLELKQSTETEEREKAELEAYLKSL